MVILWETAAHTPPRRSEDPSGRVRREARRQRQLKTEMETRLGTRHGTKKAELFLCRARKAGKIEHDARSHGARSKYAKLVAAERKTGERVPVSRNASTYRIGVISQVRNFRLVKRLNADGKRVKQIYLEIVSLQNLAIDRVVNSKNGHLKMTSRYISPHWLAAQALPPFPPTATLRIMSPDNPWRPDSDGHRLYSKLLAADLTNATVQTAIDIGTLLGLSYSVQDHLRWLFTWGPYIEIDGKRSAHWSEL